MLDLHEAQRGGSSMLWGPGRQPADFGASHDDSADADPLQADLAGDAALMVCAAPGETPVRQAATAARGRQRAEAFAAVMARIRLRDESALATLHAACATSVFASALRIVRRHDLADEVVSRCFMQVWRDAANFDERRASVMTWLGTIARSRALDLLRRLASNAQHECPLLDADLGVHPAASADAYSRFFQAQLSRRLHAAMSRLAPAQRQVLTLAFIEGLSHEEVATRTGMPLGTVKSHARRGMAALREHAGLRDMAAQ